MLMDPVACPRSFIRTRYHLSLVAEMTIRNVHCPGQTHIVFTRLNMQKIIMSAGSYLVLLEAARERTTTSCAASFSLSALAIMKEYVMQ